MGMIGGSMLTSQFPPGFRFHPTDQELINQYLKRKLVASLPPEWAIIADIDLYKYNPWELPEKAFFGHGEWFFFSPRDRKYPNGVRPNRATTSGYWKATGTDKPIISLGGAQCIGVKKALVFYKGKPPKGIKTEWVMQEYRLVDSALPQQSKKQLGSMRLDDWVLCRVRQKGVYETEMIPSLSNTHEKLAKEEVIEKEMSSSEEWREHLSYFAESLPEDGENSGEDSSPGLMWYPSDYELEKQHLMEMSGASTVFQNKRKQSVFMLDDLHLLQPGKRLEALYNDSNFPQYF